MNISEQAEKQIEQYFERAKRIFRQKGLTEADAEDCAAEVRFCLLRNVQRGGTLSDAYFQRVVRGCLADFLQRQVPTCPLENADLCGGGEPFPYTEIEVRWALAQLKPEERELILLHDIEGYSIEELASQYGCRADCLRQRLHRARLRLKKLLE